MSKIIPSAYIPLDTIDLRTRSPVRADTFKNVAEGQNYLYADSGARLAGIIFEDASGAGFKRETATGYSTAPDNDVQDLNRWRPQVRFKRPGVLGACYATIDFFSKNCQLYVYAFNARTGASRGASGQSGISPEWKSFTFTLSADTFGVDDPVYFTAGCLRRNAATLELFQISIREAILTPTQLP